MHEKDLFQIKKSNIINLFTPIIYLISLFLLFLSIKEQAIGGIVFLSIFLILISLGIAFGSMYGFKIDDKYIRIVSQKRREKYEIDSIQKIDVIFTKDKKYYKIDANVFLYDSDTLVNYTWHYIYNGKGAVRFNITEKNINDYINLLSSCDKFKIEIKSDQ